ESQLQPDRVRRGVLHHPQRADVATHGTGRLMLLTTKPPKCKHCRRRLENPRQRLHDECVDGWVARQLAKQAEAKARKDRAETKARKAKLETIPELIAAAQKEFNAFIRERDRGQPCI